MREAARPFTQMALFRQYTACLYHCPIKPFHFILRRAQAIIMNRPVSLHEWSGAEASREASL